jgi:crotonobetainyl-CoA:carnitine CoA-transferase CaiB-like acyl-CoA transferase
VLDAQSALDDAARQLGSAIGVDGPELLRERADILGIAPNGTISAGGTCRLFGAGNDQWVALNLARRADVELLGAWMERDWQAPVWDAVAEALRGMTAEHAVERAQLLGIPAAVAVPAPDLAPQDSSSPDSIDLRGTQVVDLSALWAGPLCARLLGARGASVVKVEHSRRPDGARAGSPAFWTLLNGAKKSVMLDFDSIEGRRDLQRLLDAADVVITAARPRAIEQLGFDLERRVREQSLTWVSITGYGYRGEWSDRVAFGDDAAVAGGLAVAAGGVDAPVFVADAPADPLAGLHGALQAARSLAAGGGAFIDVSMRDAVASSLAGAADRYDAGTDQEVALWRA